MNKKRWRQWAILALLLVIMALGYGGLCNWIHNRNDDDDAVVTGSSAPTTTVIIVGESS